MACIAQDQLLAIAALKKSYEDHLVDNDPDLLLASSIFEGQTVASNLSATVKTAGEPDELPAFTDDDVKKDKWEKYFKECIPCDKSLFTDPLKVLPFSEKGLKNLFNKLFVDPYIASALKQLETISRMKQYLSGFFILDDICNNIRSLPPIICLPDLMAMAACLNFNLGTLLGGFKLPTASFRIDAILSFLLMPLMTAVLALLKQIEDLLIRPLECVINAMKAQSRKLVLPKIIVEQYKDRKTGKIKSRTKAVPAKEPNPISGVKGFIDKTLIGSLERGRDLIHAEFEKVRAWLKSLMKDKLKKDQNTIDKLLQIKQLKIYIEIINSLVLLTKQIIKTGKKSTTGDYFANLYKNVCSRVAKKQAPFAQLYTKKIEPTLLSVERNLIAFDQNHAKQYDIREDNAVNRDSDSSSAVASSKKATILIPNPDDENARINDDISQTFKPIKVIILQDDSLPKDFFNGTEIDDIVRNLPFDLDSVGYENEIDGSPDFNKLDFGFINAYTLFKQDIADLNQLPDSTDSTQKDLQQTIMGTSGTVSSEPQGLIVGSIVSGNCLNNDNYSNKELNRWLNIIQQ